VLHRLGGVWDDERAWKRRSTPRPRIWTRSAKEARRRPSNPYLWLSAFSVLAGGPEGEVDRLRLPYRILLNEQKFVVIHAHVSELQLETITRVHALHPANTDCPQCSGKGEVSQHGGRPPAEDLSTVQRAWLGQGATGPVSAQV